jgi:PIN domain nuclease of toxin-antitoxin system
VSFLFDTHLLLWAGSGSDRLPSPARDILATPANRVAFSPVSIWEVAIKAALGRTDFHVDAKRFHRGLLTAGYTEIAITGAHTAMIGDLPPVHKDPFDRLLVAQAKQEGLTLVTSDPLIARYSRDILLV